MEVLKPTSLLTLIASAILFFNLGSAKLWDEDEPRNAGCALEMIQHNDWIVPRFNGEIRTHKPVFLYWLMMASYQCFGVNEFSARFASALLGVGTVLLTASMGCRLVDARNGWFAGVAIASMLMFVVAARAATPDSALIFFMTASLAVFVWCTPIFGPPLRFIRRWPFFHVENQFHAENPLSVATHSNLANQDHGLFPTDRLPCFFMYGLMGFAVLTKGPVGFLIPCAVIGMFLLIYRLPPQIKFKSAILRLLHPIEFVKACRTMRLGWLVFSVLLVAIPWYVWVTLRTEGDWTRGFFFEHNLGRATGTMESHSGGPFFYLVAFAMGTFPWSIFLIPVIIDIVQSKDERSERENASLIFLVCWIGVVVGLFSMASTKLPSYITPCYPAAAILVARYFLRQIEQRAKLASYWPHVSFGVLICIGLVVAVLIPRLGAIYVPDANLLASIGLMLSIGGATMAWAWFHRKTNLMGVTMLGTSCLFAIMTFGWGAARVSRQQKVDRLVQSIQDQSDHPQVAQLGAFRSTWVYYLGVPVKSVASGNPQTAVDFLLGNNDRFLIVTDDERSKLELAHPESPIVVISSTEFFLQPGKHLHVLKAKRSHHVARAASEERWNE